MTGSSWAEYLVILGFVALPALGNFAGGLLAELVTISNRVLSLALHAAVGVVIGVVAVELVPTALETEVPWVVILAFWGGGLFFVLLDRSIEYVQSRFTGRGSSASPWMIFAGVCIDLFSDGVMIGTGSTIGFEFGLLLALGQVPADIPEGFATIATFRRQGLAFRYRLWLAAAFGLPLLLGATIGFWGLRNTSDLAKLTVLAFTAGLLTTVVVEEMGPEAHRTVEPQLGAIVLVSGFALFAFLATSLKP
ncbi:MAG: Zinc transporter ZupT [Nitrospira sp. OLB3]|nr:MAG: Zinc transporter ZupT [Nitrospira sp. OLB3]